VVFLHHQQKKELFSHLISPSEKFPFCGFGQTRITRGNKSKASEKVQLSGFCNAKKIENLWREN
jgi:hypothetical protein